MNGKPCWKVFWNKIIRDSQYMKRTGFRTNKWLSVFIHKYYGPDEAPFHSHPWKFMWSVVLRGGLVEQEPFLGTFRQIPRSAFWKFRFDSKPRIMTNKTFHRIQAVEPGTITLFVGWSRITKWKFADNKRRV